MTTVGVILAGGTGRRIGGGKPFRPLAGKPLIAHVVDRLRPQVDALRLSAPEELPELNHLGIPLWPDGPSPSGSSAFAGIVASLAMAAEGGFDLAAIVPCDTPLLPTELVATLTAAVRQTGTHGIVIRASGRLHPTIGLWLPGALPVLRSYFADGGRSLHGAVERTRAATFDAADTGWPGDAFLNVNTPEELAAAAKLLAREKP